MPLINISSLHKKLADPLYKRYPALYTSACFTFGFKIFSLTYSCSFHPFPHGTLIHYAYLKNNSKFLRKGPQYSNKIKYSILH